MNLLPPDEINLRATALARHGARHLTDLDESAYADQRTLVSDLERIDLEEVTIALANYVAIVAETVADLLGADTDTLLQLMIEASVNDVGDE